MPLELFVLVGTFVEELLSPIPSFAVLVPAGAVANAQERGVAYLLVLMVFSAIGRIGAGVILYWIADKSEDKLLANGRRFFGISHKEIERFGQRLGKSPIRDWTLLFVFNAIPIFPTGALSILCGFVKVRFRMFAITTFFGTMINALIYMAIGYGGFRIANSLEEIQTIMQIVAAALVICLVVWFVHRRRRALTQHRKSSV